MSSYRSKFPEDDQWFSGAWLPVFREAVDDQSYLLSRGYATNAALELVGNRYHLNQRQRMAVRRMSASTQEVANRRRRECHKTDLAHQAIDIDGFNLLILLESALSGGYVLYCRDGVYRDIASVHGAYKRVIKTEEAVRLLGDVVHELQITGTRWFLDAPVSNSGKLKTFLQEICKANGYSWEVEVVSNPDQELVKSTNIVISSDGWILDKAEKWYNLGAYLIEHKIKGANVIKG